MSDKRTCLYDKHVALGAKMVPFGGFEMPIQYSDITEEHNAVRHGCGVFDVSHMGEILITGEDAERFVQHIFTNDISNAPAGKIFYGMMLHENGGTVDDLLVYKMAEKEFLLVVNAANIDKDDDWIKSHTEGFDVATNNQSEHYGQLAIQGPQSEEIMRKVLELPCEEIEFYNFKTMLSENENIIVSRTGYTGEDGFEIYASHNYVNRCWNKLMDSGKVKPCGLGCRDTMRFEVGLPLYGDELTDEISPIMAGLGIFVKTDKTEFIGKEAILQQKAEGIRQKIVGIELSGRAIPRHGYEVEADGKVIGIVTTGYCSISTGKSVCMALIDAANAKLGNAVEVRIHRKLHPGIITKKRFYEKNYKK